MDLVLQRMDATQHSTPGTLEGIMGFTFQTLEPPPTPDPEYVNCPVCIPSGRYQIQMYPSPHFKASVPLLLDVPGRSSIEMHYGNVVEHEVDGHIKFESEGCILCGDTRLNADEILGTQDACLNHIWPTIAAVIAGGEEVWLTVLDPA